MFKIPEKARLTEATAKTLSYQSKQLLALVGDNTKSNDGFFTFPQEGKKAGHYFLVRSTVTPGGWRFVGVYVIPHEGRSPTWEEMNYIKRQFWEPDDIVAMYHPGQHTYIADNKYWLHLWDHPRMTMPPLFTNHAPREANFFIKLWRAFKRKLKELWNSPQTKQKKHTPTSTL